MMDRRDETDKDIILSKLSKLSKHSMDTLSVCSGDTLINSSDNYNLTIYTKSVCYYYILSYYKIIEELVSSSFFLISFFLI